LEGLERSILEAEVVAVAVRLLTVAMVAQVL
jgi:hypothetical protein